MAKKRIITQDMNFDEQFNKLPIGSQILFYRFLSITDDCGVIPANEYTLHSMINTPQEIKKNYSKLLKNILDLKLMYRISYNGKEFLCFKRHSFEEMQKFLIKNRTRSEYTKLQLQEFFEVYSKLQENTVIYSDMEHINIEIKTKDKDRDKEGGKKILFKETEYYNDFPKFKEKFLTDKYKQYDAEHYYEAVKNWSDGKGEKRIDWIAVARSFVKNDGNNPRLSKNGNIETIKLPD